MLVDVGSEFDLFDIDDLLLLSCLVGALLGLVLVFAVVEDLADRGVDIGLDLDQVEPGRVGPADCVVDVDDT